MTPLRVVWSWSLPAPEVEGFEHAFSLEDGSELWLAGWVGGLEAWRRDGPECLRRLEGEFLLVHWSAREQRLWVAQSRLAGFHVFYRTTPDGFALSTRIQDLLGAGDRLDGRGFVAWASGYAWLRQELERSCFEGVARLPEAWRLRVERGDLRAERYWLPEAVAVDPNPEAALAEVRLRMEEAVADACRGHASVGSLLSGGLDSSAVTGLAARVAAVTAVSSVLSPQYRDRGLSDERRWIELAARHFGVPVRWVHPPRTPGPWSFADEHFEWCPFPRLSPRHDLYRALCAAASEAGCTVLLDGQGGEMGPSANRRSGLKSFLRTLFRRPRRRTPLVLLSPEARPDPAALDPPAAGGRIGIRMLDTKVMQAVGLHGSRVFLRRPLLSPRLIEYCAGLPMEMTMKKGLDRAVIRSAAGHVLPIEVALRRDKLPFSPDYELRCQDALADALSEWRELRGLPLVQEWLDVPSLDALLERRPTALFTAQATLAAAQFLRWCSGLSAVGDEAPIAAAGRLKRRGPHGQLL